MAQAGGVVDIRHTAELTGHTDAATAVEWADDECIYSGSMDHSVRAPTLTLNPSVRRYQGAVSSTAVPWTTR